MSPRATLLTGRRAAAPAASAGPVRRIKPALAGAPVLRLFLKAQRRRADYLRPGDTVAARIFGADGTLDLGEQTNHRRRRGLIRSRADYAAGASMGAALTRLSS